MPNLLPPLEYTRAPVGQTEACSESYHHGSPTISLTTGRQGHAYSVPDLGEVDGVDKLRRASGVEGFELTTNHAIRQKPII